MVRKDAKIGLAIGGILALVLLSYVVAVSGKKPTHKTNEDELSLNSTNDPAAPASTEVGTGAGTTAIDPRTSTDVGTSVADGTKTDPAKDAAWSSVLQNGQTVLSVDQKKPEPLFGNGSEPAGTTTLNVDPAPIPPTKPTGLENGALGGGLHSPAPAHVDSADSHTIVAGETLSSIAKAKYGSSSKADLILSANPGLNPTRLKIGAVLKLPDVPTAPAISASTAAPVSPTSPKAQPSKAIDAKTEYEIESGDSLHSIAKKLYGDVRQWQSLYDLNKSTIGPDPAKLKLHTVLKLPTPPAQPSIPASSTPTASASR